MRKYIAAAAVTVIATFAAIPGQAAANTVVAVPGSQIAGYATTQIVVTAADSAPVTFVNLDPTAPHNVVSDKLKSNEKPLFTSGSPINGPGSAEITGLAGLPAGDYTFYCAPHRSTMTGVITIV